MYCRKCGKQISDHIKFCNYCGTPVETTEKTQDSNSGYKIEDTKVSPALEHKKKGPMIAVCCIVIVILILLMIISFLMGSMSVRQNKNSDETDKVDEWSFENNTNSDKSHVDEAQNHAEEIVTEDTASTQEKVDIDEAYRPDLSQQDYSEMVENMRRMHVSDSSHEDMLVWMTRIAVFSSYQEDGRGNIQKKYSNLSAQDEMKLNYYLVEMALSSQFYGLEEDSDTENGALLLYKSQLENLYRDFYGKTTDIQWSGDYYYDDYDAERVAFYFGDGEPWYTFRSYELKENDNYYLVSVPVTYGDNGDTEKFVGYGDFLFAKSDNSFGATLVYSEFGNWDGRSLARSATASSQLPDYHEKNYRPNNVCDGNLNTVWVEGVNGVGRNEYIELDLGEIKKVSGLEIYNGYLENKYLFEINGYVTRVRVEAPGQDTVEASLMTYPLDGEKEPLDEYEIDMERSLVEFDQPVYTDRLIVTILDAESGSKYEDTCISEMVVY